jgi:hypothetical protein
LKANDKDDAGGGTIRSQLTNVPPGGSKKRKTACVDKDMIVELMEHGVSIVELDECMNGGAAFGNILEGLMAEGKIAKTVGATLLLKYHHDKKTSDNKTPRVVACNSLSTGSTLSESSEEEGRVKDHELQMAEQARSHQGSSAGRVSGKARVDNGMVQHTFRTSLWPEFKFVFSNAETEWNSSLARAYYSCMDIQGHADRFEHWTKAMPIGRRTLNDKRSSVTGTMREIFIRKPIHSLINCVARDLV